MYVCPGLDVKISYYGLCQAKSWKDCFREFTAFTSSDRQSPGILSSSHLTRLGFKRGKGGGRKGKLGGYQLVSRTELPRCKERAVSGL